MTMGATSDSQACQDLHEQQQQLAQQQLQQSYEHSKQQQQQPAVGIRSTTTSILPSTTASPAAAIPAAAIVRPEPRFFQTDTEPALPLEPSPSVEPERCSLRATNATAASQEALAATQPEILTQNPDLTQLEEDEDSRMFPPDWMAANMLTSPRSQRNVPWGKIIPCSSSTCHSTQTSNAAFQQQHQQHDNHRSAVAGGINLLPRPAKRQTALANTSSQDSAAVENGISMLGLVNLRRSDIFNEHVFGRSSKCDVFASKPPTKSYQDEKQKARYEWAYGMISNRHCRIYCCLSDRESPVPAANSAASTVGHRYSSNMQVYIEDCSGNGTVINKTVVLRRGEKRLLHSGDEICLVNPRTLSKRIRSVAHLHTVLQQFSYIFVREVVLFPAMPSSSNVASTMTWLAPSTALHPPPVQSHRLSSGSSQCKVAVNVRATKSHGYHDHYSSSFFNRTGISQNQSRPLECQQLLVAECSASQQSTADIISQSSNPPFPQPKPHHRRVSPRRFCDHRRIEEDYDVRDLLGSGTVGEVRRAIDRRTGQERAVKIIAVGRYVSGAAAQHEARAAFAAEAAILQELDHPYVIQLIDVYVSTMAVYLVMELLQGGDLFDRIMMKGRYTEVECRRLMRRLLSAIHYLHEERNVVHRDLKPENILCTSRNNHIDIKLTDFGLAKAVNGDDGLKTFCGTPQYFAPEVLRRRHTITGRGRYGKQADMWSIGVILYVLLSGTQPFDVSEDGMEVVAQAVIEFPNEHWHGVSDSAKDLVLRLLIKDPRQRWSVQQACHHPWILTDDGDTHVHPLEDPHLAAAFMVTTKKRLSFGGPPPPDDDVEHSKANRSCTGPTDANVEEVAPIAPTPTQGCLSSMENQSIVETTPSAPWESNPDLNSSLVRPMVDAVPADHSGRVAYPPRRPLSPVSTNSQASGSGKIEKTDDIPIKKAYWVPPAKPDQHHQSVPLHPQRSTIAATTTTENPFANDPSPVQAVNAIWRSMETTADVLNKSPNQARILPIVAASSGLSARCLMELADDEIKSQFSDATEKSIGSFSNDASHMSRVTNRQPAGQASDIACPIQDETSNVAAIETSRRGTKRKVPTLDAFQKGRGRKRRVTTDSGSKGLRTGIKKTAKMKIVSSRIIVESAINNDTSIQQPASMQPLVDRHLESHVVADRNVTTAVISNSKKSSNTTSHKNTAVIVSSSNNTHNCNNKCIGGKQTTLSGWFKK